MLLLHHREVFESAKVMVFLEEDGIVFVLLEIENGLKIFLIKIFLLEFLEDDVSLFGLSESSQEDIEIVLDLFNLFCINL